MITADTTGVLKLWDLRTFGCVQTFQTEHTKGDLNDMTGFQALTHVKRPKILPKILNLIIELYVRRRIYFSSTSIGHEWTP